MAKSNKFKNPKVLDSKSADSTVSKKPSKPSPAPPISTSKARTRPREPNSSDGQARTRPRTSAKPWADGDQEPRFAKPTAPILDEGVKKAPTSSSPVETFTGPPNYESLLPSHIASALSSQFDVHCLHVLSGAKINAKVSILLRQLENGFSLGKTNQKPGMVALISNASVANKLISIVEIAKRELERSKYKWFEYSAVATRVEQIKVNMEKESGRRFVKAGRTLEESIEALSKDVDMQDEAIDLTQDDEDEEEAFETMTLPVKSKVRAVPYLTIFMSRVPVPQLKAEYGEQSYDPRKDRT